MVSKLVPYWEGNEERPQTGGWHFYKQENSLTRPVFLSWGAAKRRRCLPRPHPRHQNLTIYTEASMGSVTGTTRWSQQHPVLKARPENGPTGAGGAQSEEDGEGGPPRPSPGPVLLMTSPARSQQTAAQGPHSISCLSRELKGIFTVLSG